MLYDCRSSSLHSELIFNFTSQLNYRIRSSDAKNLPLLLLNMPVKTLLVELFLERFSATLPVALLLSAIHKYSLLNREEVCIRAK